MINNWKELLVQEQEKDYFKLLKNFIDKEYDTYTIFPPKANMFFSFRATPFDKVKVVILGQDPYIQPNQAHGLAFSVLCDTLPPSLKNIYREIHTDLGIKMPETNGDLTKWAQQGVLLLNTTLTVRMGQSNSHAKRGWGTFTDRVIEELAQKDSPIVFLLWGKFAQGKQRIIEKFHNDKHYVLTAPHPSPLSAYQGFFGCKHFSKTNELLKLNGLEEIDWSIPERSIKNGQINR